MIYDEERIELLLKCRKVIVDPPTKDYKLDRGHKKKNFTMHSIDGLYDFRGFIRYNTKFNENFSIGIDYKPKEEKSSICLIRLNGAHGENKEIPHHNKFHIHKATVETLNNGLKPESNVEITDKYSTLSEAIQYFIEFINLNNEDRIKYFPEKQLELFNDNE